MTHCVVAIYCNDQNIAKLGGLLQVSYVTYVEQIEATVGEDD